MRCEREQVLGVLDWPELAGYIPLSHAQGVMWLYYALVAFATRPTQKQHDEILKTRMTYTGGAGCIPEAYTASCDVGCGSCDSSCNGSCDGGKGKGGGGCDALCHLSCDQASHLAGGASYTHHTSCDEEACETGCDEEPFLNTDSDVRTQGCDEQCAYVDGCDHQADCDEVSCDDSSSTGGSAIHSCDFTDGGQSCDYGCEYSIAGVDNDGTEGANNEAESSSEDYGFLNAGSSDCGR